MEPFLVSKGEAAKLLGICQRKLEFLIRDREIRPRKIGRRCLISMDELHRFANPRSTLPVPVPRKRRKAS